MMMHYFMWIVIAISFIIGGALYRGQQDMLINEARAEGAALILNNLTLTELTNQKI